MLETDHHRLQFGRGVGDVQTATGNFDHRSVGGSHHRQRCGVAFEEHQGGVCVTGRLPDCLCQRTGGVQFGYQDDIVDAVGPQHTFEPGRGSGVIPDHPGGDDPMPALSCAVPGAKDARERRRGRVIGGEVETAVVDSGSVGVLTLDQNHPNCRGCHRHTENDVHVPLRWLNR